MKPAIIPSTNEGTYFAEQAKYLAKEKAAIEKEFEAIKYVAKK